MQGDYLIANVISFQGIFHYKFKEQDQATGEEVEPLVVSDDPNFRPVDIEIGPDGAIYFLDWENAIIGHMQHHLRDPSRDHTHGRIFRVTYPSRPLLEPAKSPMLQLINCWICLKNRKIECAIGRKSN